MLVFLVEQVFLELFEFTHGTLFWDTPVCYEMVVVQCFMLVLCLLRNGCSIMFYALVCQIANAILK